MSGNYSSGDFTCKPTTPIAPLSRISVTSPSGGETWMIGTTETISWFDSSPKPMYACPVSFIGGVVGNCRSYQELYDISLIPAGSYYLSDNSQIIAESVPGNSYNWTIPNYLSGGLYMVQVCKTGTEVCGLSNGPVNIYDLSIRPVPMSYKSMPMNLTY
jgi:hypothetical protein